ncbi:unnamed protein product [Closterium sp. NIES-53]
MEPSPKAPSTVPATAAQAVSHFNPRPFPFLLVLVGPPGSGKSRFAGLLIADAALRYERVCQDVASARGTPGTRKQCLAQVSVNRSFPEPFWLFACSPGVHKIFAA